MDMREKFFPARDLLPEQIEAINEVQEKFCELAELLDERMLGCREMSLAITKLQEAKMWAVEGIAKQGVAIG